MAIFGAPLDDPDYATRLLETGMSILEEAVKLTEVAKSYGMTNFTIAIGGEAGSVLAGTVGSADRMEYTLIGDTVNVASRLEGLTRFFGVRFLAGESLRQKAEGWHFRNLGRIKPKGKKNSLNIFEVLGFGLSVAPEKIEEAARFEEALRLYQSRKFTEALKAWNSGEKDDPAIRWYRARANENILGPPAEDWDGSEIFRNK
jgi:adenylate cyclase